jgi:nucleobase:cation symporter-1, NCS1 family
VAIDHVRLTGICANLAIPSILVEARELPMTSAVDIERRLRAHYRQPAGVEQFGIEPVPEERKTTGWFDLFSIMFNFLINPGMMLSGGLMVAAGLSFQGALAAGFFGTIIALVFYLIMATLGVDYGIPGQVATRAVYGLRGAKLIPSLLRVIVTIYWFSFQTLVGASAIVAVLAKITGVTYPLVWVSVIFALIQACVAVIGFGSLKVLARVALPIKVMVLAYLFVLFAHHDDPNFEPAKVLSYPGASGWTWVLLAAWLNVTLAGWLTNITDAADFARYTRSRTDMWVGTIAAGALGALLSTALGAYGAAATLGKVTNPFVLTAQIETSWVAFLAVLVFLCVDDWTINVLNLYSGGLSLSNMFERLGRFWTTLIASVFGVALSGVPDVLNFFEYVTWFGNVFSPVAGVLVFDYLFVRRMQIDVVALYDPKGRYRYWAGFNPIAVAWTVVGFLICTYVIPTAWIPALLTLLITGVGYLLTVWILQHVKVPPQWGIP